MKTSELIKLDKDLAKTSILQITSEDSDDSNVGIMNLLNMDDNDATTKAWVSYIIWCAKGYPIHVKEGNEVKKWNIVTALKYYLNKTQLKKLGKLCFDYDLTDGSSDDDISSKMTGEWLLERFKKEGVKTEDLQQEYATVFLGVIVKETKKSGYLPQNVEIEIILK